MNEEVYVLRLINKDNNVNKLIGVIKNIDLVHKIAYKLYKEDGYVFEPLASDCTSKYWKFQCLNCETLYLIVNRVKVIE